MSEPLKTRVFECIFDWNFKVITAALLLNLFLFELFLPE